MELENYGSFCYSGDCTNPIWNCYDEALVSPELMYSINSYRYLKRIGDRDLIAKVRPNSKISDHLPLLVFTIEFGPSYPAVMAVDRGICGDLVKIYDRY